jgi:hypothetical protein
MATYKRIDGDYNITTINSSDNVVVTTHTLTVNGNLNVKGELTYIEVTELKVDDPFILVAANNAGSFGSPTYPDQGLVTQTSANTFAGIRFDNANSAWQISPSVDANGAPITAYANIAAGSGVTDPGGPNNSVQFNNGGVFGGDADYSFDAANVRVTLNGAQNYGNIGTAPSAVANTVSVYHNAQGSGGTGLYVKSPIVEDELVSKTKAIVFGIIF